MVVLFLLLLMAGVMVALSALSQALPHVEAHFAETDQAHLHVAPLS